MRPMSAVMINCGRPLPLPPLLVAGRGLWVSASRPVIVSNSASAIRWAPVRAAVLPALLSVRHSLSAWVSRAWASRPWLIGSSSACKIPIPESRSLPRLALRALR